MESSQRDIFVFDKTSSLVIIRVNGDQLGIMFPKYCYALLVIVFLDASYRLMEAVSKVLYEWPYLNLNIHLID